MEFLYGNIGGKIKYLAFFTALLGALGSFVSGVMLMTTDSYFIGYGVLLIIVGPIVAWVSSWILYGFGEIITSLQSIDGSTGKNRRQTQPTTSDPFNTPANPTSPAKKTSPEGEDSEMVVDYCPTCNTMLKFNRNAKFVSCPSCKSTLEVTK